MDDPLLRFRERFPILAGTNYLISNSLGAMPARARDRLAEYADTWASRGVRAWGEGWWEMAVRTGDLLRPILGTGRGQVTFHQNVSLATSVFLSSLDFRGERNKLVIVDLEFPSLMYVYHQHPDAEVVTIRSEDGLSIDVDKVCEAIDERTRLVAFSHVLFKSSFLMDAPKIAARARQMGALTYLDVFQSAGTMPIDVAAWGIDAVTGGCLKWLCGGPGNGFLWVDPAIANTLRPRVTGWQAHRRPFAFEPGAIEFREDAWRFLTGTPNIPALYAASPGLEIVAEAGTQAIRDKSIRQTTALIEFADARGWKVNASRDPDRRGGTVALDVPHAKHVAAELNARDVCVDFRPGAGVRLSPHFYTSHDQLVHAVDAIDDVLRTEAWRKHDGVERAVT